MSIIEFKKPQRTNFDEDPNYETKIGYDYDVVFCMSLLHWVQDKERLLRYLSHFDQVLSSFAFEPGYQYEEPASSSSPMDKAVGGV